MSVPLPALILLGFQPLLTLYPRQHTRIESEIGAARKRRAAGKVFVFIYFFIFFNWVSSYSPRGRAEGGAGIESESLFASSIGTQFP
jgi:hypothetical protein